MVTRTRVNVTFMRTLPVLLQRSPVLFFVVANRASEIFVFSLARWLVTITAFYFCGAAAQSGAWSPHSRGF